MGTKTEKRMQVISPDGFRIEREPASYKNREAAMVAFKKWKKNYEPQGYYSSCNHGRIDLRDLEDFCEFVEL